MRARTNHVLWSQAAIFVPMLGLVPLACDSGSPEVPATTVASEASEPPKKTSADDPTPDPITHPCVVKAAQFDVALAAADVSCRSDADCDCYPGGVTRKAGCGGVTSAASAKELHGIAQAFRADGCDWAQQCAAQVCDPKCVDGSCQ
jgi:hypothetical protein